jgi:hypothetical protein
MIIMKKILIVLLRSVFNASLFITLMIYLFGSKADLWLLSKGFVFGLLMTLLFDRDRIKKVI